MTDTKDFPEKCEYATGYWQCINTDCDGVHHYLAKIIDNVAEDVVRPAVRRAIHDIEPAPIDVNGMNLAILIAEFTLIIMLSIVGTLIIATWWTS